MTFWYRTLWTYGIFGIEFWVCHQLDLEAANQKCTGCIMNFVNEACHILKFHSSFWYLVSVHEIVQFFHDPLQISFLHLSFLQSVFNLFSVGTISLNNREDILYIKVLTSQQNENEFISSFPFLETFLTHCKNDFGERHEVSFI